MNYGVYSKREDIEGKDAQKHLSYITQSYNRKYIKGKGGHVEIALFVYTV